MFKIFYFYTIFPILTIEQKITKWLNSCQNGPIHTILRYVTAVDPNNHRFLKRHCRIYCWLSGSLKRYRIQYSLWIFTE